MWLYRSISSIRATNNEEDAAKAAAATADAGAPTMYVNVTICSNSFKLQY